MAAAALSVGACGSSQQAAQSTPSPTATASPREPGSSAGEDVLDRLPEVPEATEGTRPPASADGAGGNAFLTAVFEDVQAMWKQDFEAAGVPYLPATMTIFRDEVRTACGVQPASVGPFYCPADHGVYLDIEDALRAAAVVGDDFQQVRATGTITPHDWTHGSSRQRQHWLTTGFEQGEPSACDTFAA